MSLFVTFLADHLTVLLAVVVGLLSGLWLWAKYNCNYWQRHNIPFIRPHPFFGNFKDIFFSKHDICTHLDQLYNHEVAKGQPVVGIHVMQKPALLIRNIELVKAILIKDFNKFSNRYQYADHHRDSLGADNVFFAKNPKWKEIRIKLTPVFSSGKMKQMFPLVEEIGRELDQHLLAMTEKAQDQTVVQEIKELNALFTTDVIATVAFGVQANSLKNPSSDFRENGKRVFNFTGRRALEFFSIMFWPSIVQVFGFKVFSGETTKFIKRTFNYVMGERIKSGLKRNDLIDVLIKFKQEAEADTSKKHFILEKDCLISQAAIFFTAGFETSSATMSFSLYELARNQSIQERLREEIREALVACNGVLTYEAIMDMKYLEMVVREVLRMYPPLPFLDRECTLAPNESGYSLKPYVDFEIPNGMPVYIPAHCLQMDDQYFPNAREFDPERFAPENKDRVNMNAYLSFGSGPHSCIGERFGILQSKVGLVNFLRNHYVTPCEKSHKQMKLDPKAILIQADGGIFCNIVRDPLLLN